MQKGKEAIQPGETVSIEELKKEIESWKGSMPWLSFSSSVGNLQKWTNNVWFPRVLESGIKYIAVVVSETALARMSVKAIMTKSGGTTNKYFDNLAEAEEWMNSNQWYF